MNAVGQLSRTLNQVFTPITHSLLPTIAAPGQLSAAEINSMSHSMGQLQRLRMYAIGNVRANGQAIFLEKCLNELSLPHQIICLTSQETIESLLRQSDFGGAYLSPPLSVTKAYYLPKTTEACARIGYADTIVASTGSSGRTLTCDNAMWKGVRAALIRDYVPSAYANRPALVLANSENEAATAMYALRSLRVGTIYTVGFAAHSYHGQTHHFRDLADMKEVPEPFVMVSALPTEKSMVVSPLLKHYNHSLRPTQRPGKVFLDLSNAVNIRKDNSVAIAAKLGWRSYGINVVNHYTMVETLRLLLGFNVGYDFVRLASGRCLFD
jgi:3-dehydroquinate dehydratase-1